MLNVGDKLICKTEGQPETEFCIRGEVKKVEGDIVTISRALKFGTLPMQKDLTLPESELLKYYAPLDNRAADDCPENGSIYKNLKNEMEKQIGAGHASLEQLMLYQELLYRIEVLYASQAFCQTAPVTTDVAVLSGHYQLVDAYIQCLTKERRLGQPADQNLKAKRQTASETLDKVVLDCRKRFSSFTPTDQNQYRKGVSSLINTVLPVWLKLRNTYINISK